METFYQNKKLIITAAITGAETTKKDCPHLPTKPKDQARAALECYKAGASIIHLHVRDDQDQPTQSVERFQETIHEIQKLCPVLIQISTGGAVGDPMDQRLKPLSLKPHMATLNMGSVNFGQEVFTNLPQDIEAFALEMKNQGVMPELEVYEVGMIETALRMYKKNKLPSRVHIQFVMGTGSGISGDPHHLSYLARLLPSDWEWGVAGIGRYQLPLAAQAIVMGGHVRVGFEDNIYFSKGVLAASNAQLVERIKSLAELLQRPVATVEETRDMLHIDRPW